MVSSEQISRQQNEFLQAISQGDAACANTIAHKVFDELKSDQSDATEDLLAFYACNLFERELPDAYNLLCDFIDRFPGSAHLPRVYRADLLAQAGEIDHATHDARIYLRQMKDAGAFPKLETYHIVRYGVTKAFLLLTAAYTELGARSYSQRVLKYALSLTLDPKFEGIKVENARLLDELKMHDNQEINQRWESFFASGRFASDLHKLAQERRYPILAKRVDLLENNFRLHPNYQLDDEEIFQIVLWGNDKDGKEVAVLR